jgi:Domain of unknown function (DUF4105)
MMQDEETQAAKQSPTSFVGARFIALVQTIAGKPGATNCAPAGLRFAFLLLALICACSLVNAQTENTTPGPPGTNLEVSLITFGPGTEVWERFGHNAIAVRDRESGRANLYNYGIFDFSQENFFANFARGLMLYRAAATDPAEELPNYVAEGRWIVQQELNFSPAQRQKLVEFLDWNVREENAQYRYDYFRANCSTKVRDALDAALGGAIKAQTIAPSRGFTYRMDADRLMRPELSIMLGIDAGLGPFSDQRLSYWDESFVPTEFMRHIRQIKVRDEAGNEVPLVAKETLINKASIPDPPEMPPDWIWRALVIGIVSALALLGLARLRAQTWARVGFAAIASLSALFFGLAGLVLAGLWGFTDHVAAWRNENLLLFDPLCLLLLPAWFMSARRKWQPSRFARRVAVLVALLAGFAFFAKVWPAFPQDNRFWIALLLPIQIAFAVVLWNSRRSSKTPGNFI